MYSFIAYKTLYICFQIWHIIAQQFAHCATSRHHFFFSFSPLFYFILLDVILLDLLTRPGPKTANAFSLFLNKRFSLLMLGVKAEHMGLALYIDFQSLVIDFFNCKSVSRTFDQVLLGNFCRLRNKLKLSKNHVMQLNIQPRGSGYVNLLTAVRLIIISLFQVILQKQGC